ncbi:hypothetical protein G148_0447 [Riemerella anatipestifer RA-CH-2]|nr:hypothetical protein G148_0447 [Riemerella anatipestifer RA-CH-2]
MEELFNRLKYALVTKLPNKMKCVRFCIWLIAYINRVARSIPIYL